MQKPRDEQKQVFDYFDKEEKGVIKKQDLVKAVRYLGIIKNQNDFNFVIKEVDNEINYEKFSEIIAKFRETEINKNDVDNAFETFDNNKSGRINCKDMFRILSVAGEKFTEEDIELFKQYAKLPENAESLNYKSVIKNMMEILKKY